MLQNHLQKLHSWYDSSRTAYMQMAQAYLDILGLHTGSAAREGCGSESLGNTVAVTKAFQKAMEIMHASKQIELGLVNP